MDGCLGVLFILDFAGMLIACLGDVEVCSIHDAFSGVHSLHYRANCGGSLCRISKSKSSFRAGSNWRACSIGATLVTPGCMTPLDLPRATQAAQCDLQGYW